MSYLPVTTVSKSHFCELLRWANTASGITLRSCRDGSNGLILRTDNESIQNRIQRDRHFYVVCLCVQQYRHLSVYSAISDHHRRSSEDRQLRRHLRWQLTLYVPPDRRLYSQWPGLFVRLFHVLQLPRLFGWRAGRGYL